VSEKSNHDELDNLEAEDYAKLESHYNNMQSKEEEAPKDHFSLLDNELMDLL
jgi:hypothetical protein